MDQENKFFYSDPLSNSKKNESGSQNVKRKDESLNVDHLIDPQPALKIFRISINGLKQF